jgi:uncharacterized protein (DUF4415 family)
VWDIAPRIDGQGYRLTNNWLSLNAPKVLVADKEVYDWLMKYGKGYSTRINGIPRKVMEGTLVG